jgi:Ca2+-binding RTX toxin-like protein
MASAGTIVDTAENQQIASTIVNGGNGVDTAEGAAEGYTGVRDRDGGYGAEIRVKGKKIWLGTCRAPEYARPDVEAGQI